MSATDPDAVDETTADLDRIRDLMVSMYQDGVAAALGDEDVDWERRRRQILDTLTQLTRVVQRHEPDVDFESLAAISRIAEQWGAYAMDRVKLGLWTEGGACEVFLAGSLLLREVTAAANTRGKRHKAALTQCGDAGGVRV